MLDAIEGDDQGERGVVDGDECRSRGFVLRRRATVTSARRAWPNPSVHVLSAPPDDRRVGGCPQR